MLPRPIRAGVGVLLTVAVLAILLAWRSDCAWADPFTGQAYNYWMSGGRSGVFYNTQGGRTFGSAPTPMSNDALHWALSDTVDTTGLPLDQVRLKFTLTDESDPNTAGFASGLFGDCGLGGQPLRLSIEDLVLPPGATFVPGSASVTYSYASGHLGRVPGTLDPSSSFGPGAVMKFVIPAGGTHAPLNVPGAPGMSGQWALDATFEIVVANVPEPLTLGLLTVGALGCAAVSRMRKRRSC